MQSSVYMDYDAFGNLIKYTDAGNGTFIMRNGSTAILDGGQYDGSLEAGGGAGSRGVIEIRSGSTRLLWIAS